MPTLRERASDALLESAIARTIDRRELERGIAAVSPEHPGYETAQRAVRTARRFESALLWLGWRLQPRTQPLR